MKQTFKKWVPSVYSRLTHDLNHCVLVTMFEREKDRKTGWFGPIYEWTPSFHLQLESLFILSPVSGGGRWDHVVPPFSRGCGLVRHHKYMSVGHWTPPQCSGEVIYWAPLQCQAAFRVQGILQQIPPTHSIWGRVTVKNSVHPDQDRGWGCRRAFS